MNSKGVKAKGIDLGTYHVRVSFTDGSGFISMWGTGRRYTSGTRDTHPLDASPIAPPWESERDLISTILYGFTEGNYACDCNRIMFIRQAEHDDNDAFIPCGHTMVLARLTLIRPDGTEKVLLT